MSGVVGDTVWTIPPERGDGRRSGAWLREIEFVPLTEFEPLRTGPTAAVSTDLPRPVGDVLFSAPEDTSAACQTFAILDAAKVFGLREQLEAHSLEHKCLFTGDAADDLGDVAPWLVAFSSNQTLMRDLLTDGESPNALWGKSPGIFLRSDASFEDLWRHLRRFVKLRAADGKWFLFRFWDPSVLKSVARDAIKADPQFALSLCWTRQGGALQWISLGPDGCFTVRAREDTKPPDSPLLLPPSLIQEFGHVAERSFLEDVTKLHGKLYRVQVGLRGSDNIFRNNIAITQDAKALGCRTKYEISYLCFMGIWLGRGLLHDPAVPWVRAGAGAPGGMARVIAWRKAFDQYVAEVHGLNGEHLAAACAVLLRHAEIAALGRPVPGLERSVAHELFKSVYPQKYNAVGTNGVDALLDNLMPHPFLNAEDPRKVWFYVASSFMLGRGFASDPTTPFFHLMQETAPQIDDLLAKACRILKARSRPMPVHQKGS